MVNDYNQMEWAANPAFKGGEGALCAKMITDELNKILLGRLEPGSSIGLHTHEDSSEIMSM